MIKDCVCKDCGRAFRGGPRAWYCPECSAERRRLNYRAHRQRKKLGAVRPLGSQDTCIICGAVYLVSGGNQKYCDACREQATKEVDRRQGMEYYLKNRDSINKARAEKKFTKRICPSCGQEFTTKTKQLTCGNPQCRRDYINARARAHHDSAKNIAKCKAYYYAHKKQKADKD